MKKGFSVGRLRSSKDLRNGLIVAYRANNRIQYQNLEIPNGAYLKWDRKTEEFSINFKLKEGDVVGMGEFEGIAEKGELL